MFRSNKSNFILLALLILGLITVVFGFFYDVLNAGIPYQDPTPEMQASYNRHRTIANIIITAGGLLIFLAVIFSLKNWVKKKFNYTS